jgi:hypothetical protein
MFFVGCSGVRSVELKVQVLEWTSPKTTRGGGAPNAAYGFDSARAPYDTQTGERTKHRTVTYEHRTETYDTA